jgi:hypothetical protein
MGMVEVMVLMMEELLERGEDWSRVCGGGDGRGKRRQHRMMDDGFSDWFGASGGSQPGSDSGAQA